MTSLLPEEKEKCNVTRLKKKSQSHAVIGKSCSALSRDETRSFLEFSRENLSISNSDLEQGFNRTTSSARLMRCCCLCNRQTLLSCAALLLALSCAGLEVWKLRRVLANAKEIEIVKRDIDALKHRFLERDLLDELKAFEQQLYGESGDHDEDADLSSNSSDYDSSYDESSTVSSNTEMPQLSSTATGSTTEAPCSTSKDLEDVLAVLRRAELERGRELSRERELLLREQLNRRHKTNARRKRKSSSNSN